jgi:large subunit ribosomal protein L15
LTAKLTVSANSFSANAKEIISNSGGLTLIEFKTNQLQAVAHALNVTNVTAKELSQCYEFVSEDDKIHIVAEGSLRLKFDAECHLIDTSAHDLFNTLGTKVVVLS